MTDQREQEIRKDFDTDSLRGGISYESASYLFSLLDREREQAQEWKRRAEATAAGFKHCLKQKAELFEFVREIAEDEYKPHLICKQARALIAKAKEGGEVSEDANTIDEDGLGLTCSCGHPDLAHDGDTLGCLAARFDIEGDLIWECPCLALRVGRPDASGESDG